MSASSSNSGGATRGSRWGGRPPSTFANFLTIRIQYVSMLHIRVKGRDKKRKKLAERAVARLARPCSTRPARSPRSRLARSIPNPQLAPPTPPPCSCSFSIRRRPPLVAPCSIRRPGAAAVPFAHRFVVPPSLPYSPIPSAASPAFPA